VNLLVFAHTPPPHHGQSFMVQLLLEGLRSDSRFQVSHINAQLSSGMQDIGRKRIGKVLALLGYCMHAIWQRLRHGTKTLYYVPGNPGRAPLYRDWMVMLLCRPFFSKRVFHWHAAGLGDWLEQGVRPWERWLSQRLLGRPALSIVLSDYNRRDGVLLESRRIEVVANGIPDPCPQFAREVLLARAAALEDRMKAGAKPVFQLLYIGLCLKEKGLFDAMEAVRLANQKDTTTTFKLRVAGTFWFESERAEFEERCRDLKLPDGGPQVEYLGFVTGKEKDRLFRESHCLCFPTYYSAESFGLVVVEAFAYGLPVITTRWRMIPELLPEGYPGIVEPKSPEQIAMKMVDAIQWNFFARLRDHYLRHFTADEFWRKMRAALLSV
jgi:glycosyltransferase involved in cell wall biosynthesis